MRDLRPTGSHRGLLAALLVLALLAAQALGLAHRAVHGLGSGFGHGHGASAAVAPEHVGDPAHSARSGSARWGHAFHASHAAHESHAGHASHSAHAAHAAEAAPTAFDTHEPGSAECRLIDQAAHLDVLLAAATTAMPPRVPGLRPAEAEEDACSRGVCAYLARGPPGPVDEGRQRLG